MAVVRANGLDVFYEEAGSGPAVVLLHGSLDTGAHTFARTMPALTADFRCIRPDQRGHGRTAPVCLDWSTPQLADDVFALMDALGIERAHLVGHSMGGDVATLCAVERPERVGAVAVIGSGCAVNQKVLDYVERYDPDVIDREANAAFIQTLASDHVAGNGGDWGAMVRRTVANCKAHPIYTDEQLAAISVPMLFVRGSRDETVLDEEIARLQRLVPRMQVLDVPGAGHFPHASRATADDVNEKIRQFLLQV